jgi:hypothetical protein
MIDAPNTKAELDAEENKHKLKISKFITEMDSELQERFKALKSLQDLMQEADEEE